MLLSRARSAQFKTDFRQFVVLFIPLTLHPISLNLRTTLIPSDFHILKIYRGSEDSVSEFACKGIYYECQNNVLRGFWR